MGSAAGQTAAGQGVVGRAVTVRVPATSANLGPGFDSFGLALGLHDVVTARVEQAGLSIEVTGAGAATADAGEQHLVVRAMRTAFAQLGGQPPGLALCCANDIPQGFGLGSSAAAIVAGLLAARALAGDDGLARLPDDAVLRLATRMEGHPDNVAACLYGGLTIAWTPEAGLVRPGGAAGLGRAAGPAGATLSQAADGLAGIRGAGAGGTGARVARLTPLAGLAPVICVPATPLSTLAARQVLPPEVPHAAAAANSARAALLVAALTSQPGLLLDATEDFLHQRYRAASMPTTTELISKLRAAGVPAVISGAGPSVLAFAMDGAEPGGVEPGGAGPTAADIADVAAAAEADWRVMPLRVDDVGAAILSH